MKLKLRPLFITGGIIAVNAPSDAAVSTEYQSAVRMP